MEDIQKERIKSIGGFILFGFLWFSLMQWVLPALGFRT